MGEVLSQNEIDNLLQALSSGELDVEEMKDNGEKQVKNYDFARPSKFSKEHLRTLEIIFEHYGRLLSTNLPVYLRKNIQVEVMNSEAVTYSEFSNALSKSFLSCSCCPFTRTNVNIQTQTKESLHHQTPNNTRKLLLALLARLQVVF